MPVEAAYEAVIGEVGQKADRRWVQFSVDVATGKVQKESQGPRAT